MRLAIFAALRIGRYQHTIVELHRGRKASALWRPDRTRTIPTPKDDHRNEQYVNRVAQDLPNAWELFDMHNNAWEFCQRETQFRLNNASARPSNWSR